MANISHFTQTVNGVSTTYDIHDANAIPRSGGPVLTGTIIAKTTDDSYATSCGGSTFDTGASVRIHGKDFADSNYAGTVLIRAKNNSNVFDLFLTPDGTAMWGLKNLAMQEDVIPRSGGSVITGNSIARDTNTGNLDVCGGTSYADGAYIGLRGSNSNIPGEKGNALIHVQSLSESKTMILYPNGTWTWDGTACQITSDQRYKQQIAEIDDKLLDAWEDVELVQFKYNDAVDAKKDKARLHTGYVVQQIDKACQSHGVDISAYGLYCHEEYPQETEEVEVTQKDGTKTKERKVIREANEHYSLRYTEALIVECKYLRRCIERLEARLAQLENPEESQEKGADK